MNGLVRQNNSGNTEQKAEKQRRKWMGRRNLELSAWGTEAGHEPFSCGLGPLLAKLMFDKVKLVMKHSC